MLGSEQVSPVSTAVVYPPNMPAAADSMPTGDVVEDDTSDVAAELGTAGPEMETEKELVPSDIKNGDDGVEQLDSEQGKLLYHAGRP